MTHEVATGSVDALLEHVDYAGQDVRGYQSMLPAKLVGIRLILDEAVDPGWIELRNAAGAVEQRIRIA